MAKKEMIEINPKELQANPFQMIDGDWMLITAEKDGQVNTMTASWGGLGIMWHKPVAYIVIRPQRYTKAFVDAADTFSLSILPKEFKKQLQYLGTVSGRDEDKIQKSGLTLATMANTPYFEEANMVFICRKLFAQDYTPDSFIDPGIEKYYPEKDYHTLYIAEIEKLMIEKKA